MKHLSFVLSFLLLLWASASLAAGEDSSQFSVEVNPNVYPPSAFEQSGIHAVPRSAAEDEVPSPQERDAVFSKVPSLAPVIAQWDELDKDLLFVRARALSADQLKKIYPKLANRTLRDLQAAIQEEKQ